MCTKTLLLFVIAVPLACFGASAPGSASTEAEALTLTAAAGETQTCPRCGHENKAGLNYCVKCGAPLIEETPGEKIYCRQCGAASPEDSKFCTACGYALQVKKPALAPPPKKGVYFTGGLASYGGTTLESEAGRFSNDMGTSWAVGGGFVLPVWSKPGAVPLSLELSTDAGFSTIKKNLDFRHFAKFGSRTSFLPVRETAVFGAGFGPSKMIKPFCGFGGGVGIVMWKYKTVIVHEEIFSVGTAVKPLFDIPFGCEFRLTPYFALGVKANYLIIPGDIEMEWEHPLYPLYGIKANVSVPDVFLLGGVARFCF
jgi:ribosomal protein L40E